MGLKELNMLAQSLRRGMVSSVYHGRTKSAITLFKDKKHITIKQHFLLTVTCRLLQTTAAVLTQDDIAVVYMNLLGVIILPGTQVEPHKTLLLSGCGDTVTSHFVETPVIVTSGKKR